MTTFTQTTVIMSLMLCFTTFTRSSPLQRLTFPAVRSNDTNSPPVHDNTPFLFYCQGHAGAAPDGGCGGPCQRYYFGTPTNCHPASRICARGTNCLDTPADFDFDFQVCDASMTFCNGPASFHPGTDKEGRNIWNIVKTEYIYIDCVGACLEAGESD